MTVHLRSARFRKEREASWRELERLVTLIEKKGFRRLGPEAMRSLPRLYRAAVSSLSVARAVSLDQNVVVYLENLVARAYTHLYSVRRGFFESTVEFFVRYYPALFRRHAVAMAIAAGIFALGGVIAHAMVSSEPAYFHAFVDPGLAGGRGPESTPEELRNVLYEGAAADADRLAQFSGHLFMNNSRVALFCVLLGVVPGVFVFYLLFTNGLMLGAFSAIYARADLGVDLWGWLLPHGVTELFAVVVAGGAGLTLGKSILFPGRSRRLRNFAKCGQEMSSFVLMAFFMMAFAAIVEGFFRQWVTNTEVRYAVAGSTAVLWFFYLTFGGRGRAVESDEEVA